MLNLKEWIFQVVTGDTTLKNILKNNNTTAATTYNIYPLGADIAPESFPAITFQEVGVGLLMAPTGMRVGRIQLDIWSKANSMETETVYAQLSQLFNYQHSRIAATTFPNGTLYWIYEEMSHDGIEANRRLWRKTITYKVWFTTASENFIY